MPKKTLTEEDCSKLGKVLNPITNRCNNIKKTKVPKEVKIIKTPKICPDGQVLNPITNRCNKIKVKVAKKSNESPKIKEPKKSKDNEPKEPYPAPDSKYKPPNSKYSKLARKLTLDDCIKWSHNTLKNPITNYTIKEDNTVHKEIIWNCKPILDAYIKNRNNDEKVDIKLDDDDIHENSDEPYVPIPDSPDSPNIPEHPDVLEVSDIPESPESPEGKSSDELYYPDLDDKYFKEKLTSLYEFNLHKIPKFDSIKDKNDFEELSLKLCGDFEKSYYQYFVSHYLSTRTPYRGLLLYHGVGVGKTCSAITMSEGFLSNQSLYDEPKIWVIMPQALRNNFKQELININNIENFKLLANQCTGELYIKLGHLLKETPNEKNILKIKKLINSRYKLFTYDSFSTFIENEYIRTGRIVKDKIIIVDEAHNIRSSSDNEKPEKKVYTALTKVLKKGINNRLLLLTATPLYNEPEDIFDLLYLLTLNDKRDILDNYQGIKLFNDNNKFNTGFLPLIEKLASNYISYLKGKNPFTFAVKLSPKLSIPSNKYIRMLENEYKKTYNNTNIPAIYNNWLEKIEEGIVISELSGLQKKFVENKFDMDDANVFNNLQPMNIVYGDATGEKGFNTFFSREKDGVLNVRYNKAYENALYPDSNNLGKYSSKFLNICNIIKNTEGPIVIYSRFIWSGVIPLSICLEHMGFTREGATNILNNPDIIPNAPKYGFNKSPKYCILSSDNIEIMGNTSIDSLIKTFNNPKNQDGSMVKVILITPVAGEGLSFFNIREMHLIEPWFHFNRVTQIIGRGIRNCRHQSIPLEERNVTVFMHGCVNNNDTETADIHAFRIATKKLIQTEMVDKIIRDNSIDCILMKNINYFPKTLFELGPVKIKTSQKTLIDYEYGDKKELEPSCKMGKMKINYKGFRRETYNHLIPKVQADLRRIILRKIQQDEFFISYNDITKELNYDKDLYFDKLIFSSIEASVYPKILIEGYILIPHEEGIHFLTITKHNHMNIRITYKEIKKEQEKYNSKKIFKLENKGILESTIALYTSLNNSTYDALVKKIIESDELSEADEYIAKCLYSQGALILNKELSVFPRNTTDKFIGYVNIFNKSEFEPVIYINGKYRDLIDKEKIELISNRIKISLPDDMSKEEKPWGIFEPVANKKNTISTNKFKILTTGKSVGVKTGLACSSILKKNQNDILKELEYDVKKGMKSENCNIIALELFKINKLLLYPIYKPK